jgi:hypothetical protein
MFTAREVRVTAGLTPEALDYWTRTALIVPDGGLYSARSLSLAVVLAEASRLGAPGITLARIAARLTGEPHEWPDLWITSHGEVHFDDDAPASIVLHTRRVLAHAAPMLHHALSAA